MTDWIKAEVKAITVFLVVAFVGLLAMNLEAATIMPTLQPALQVPTQTLTPLGTFTVVTAIIGDAAYLAVVFWLVRVKPNNEVQPQS